MWNHTEPYMTDLNESNNLPTVAITTLIKSNALFTAYRYKSFFKIILHNIFLHILQDKCLHITTLIKSNALFTTYRYKSFFKITTSQWYLIFSTYYKIYVFTTQHWSSPMLCSQHTGTNPSSKLLLHNDIFLLSPHINQIYVFTTLSFSEWPFTNKPNIWAVTTYIIRESSSNPLL